MNGGWLAWLLGLLVAGSAPQDPTLKQCLAGCDGSDTDAATCRLQCREQEEAKRSPDVIRWRKEVLEGGSPDPSVQGGETTTTEVITPGGTSTTTEHTPSRGTPAPPRAPELRRGSSPSAARCQVMCDGHGAVERRLTCRFGCWQDERTRRIAIVRKGVGPKKTSKSAAAPAKTSPACRDRCLQQAQRCKQSCEAEGSNQATCRLQCDQALGPCERDCN